MNIFPRADKSCAEIGWTLEFKFTERIADSVNALDGYVCPVAILAEVRSAMSEGLDQISKDSDMENKTQKTAHLEEEPKRTPVWQETKNNLPAIGDSVILCNPDEFENYPFDDRSRCRQAAGYYNVIGGVGCWSIFGMRSVPLVSFPYWTHVPTMPESSIE
jgi:hypothetical protein